VNTMSSSSSLLLIFVGFSTRRDPCHQCETTQNDDERSWIPTKIIMCICRYLDTYYIIGILD